MTFVLSFAGMALLAVGGELLVRGAVGAARAGGVSPLLVGLVVVGFGTSTPELATSLFAAFAGSPGIVVGNVVGSNIANILLILGVSALVAPLAVQPGAFRRDGFTLAGSALACLAVVLLGVIDRWVGVAFVLALAGYIGWAYANERRPRDLETGASAHAAAEDPPTPSGMAAALVLTAIGIGATILGARLLVDGAIDLARVWGVSETLIGLTIVAVGTSLPELVACVIATLRGHADVAIGNAIGSCIFNAFLILGVTAIVQPIAVPPEIARLDIWALTGATALLLLFLRSRWRLERWEGGVFAVLYLGYIGYLTAQAQA